MYHPDFQHLQHSLTMSHLQDRFSLGESSSASEYAGPLSGTRPYSAQMVQYKFKTHVRNFTELFATFSGVKNKLNLAHCVGCLREKNMAIILGLDHYQCNQNAIYFFGLICRLKRVILLCLSRTSEIFKHLTLPSQPNKSLIYCNQICLN